MHYDMDLITYATFFRQFLSNFFKVFLHTKNINDFLNIIIIHTNKTYHTYIYTHIGTHIHTKATCL